MPGDPEGCSADPPTGCDTIGGLLYTALYMCQDKGKSRPQGRSRSIEVNDELLKAKFFEEKLVSMIRLEVELILSGDTISFQLNACQSQDRVDLVFDVVSSSTMGKPV